MICLLVGSNPVCVCMQSLCNACGIRYRKKKTTGSDKKKERQVLSPLSDSSTSEETMTVSSRKREIGEEDVDVSTDSRMKVLVIGKEMAVLQRPRSPMKKVKRLVGNKFGEVEQAAFLLMCLSCG